MTEHVDAAQSRAPAWLQDDQIYVLNPLCRLRNAKDHIKLWGFESKGEYELHRSYGVILALFDGRRTIADVSKIAMPLVRTANGNKLAEAQKYVRGIVAHFRLTPDEQKAKSRSPTDLPSEATLIPKDLLSAFGRVPRVSYDAREFAKGDVCDHPAMALRESVPSTINWHVTSACATDCRYCYLGRRNVQPLPLRRSLEIIDECHTIGVCAISLGGGDVLLYPDLVRVLHELEDRAFPPVRLATKAHLSRELAAALAQCGIVWEIQFSIDSTVDEVAGYLVRTDGYCDRVFESIENACAAGLRVSSKSVITPYNVLLIPRLYRDLKARGVQTVRLASYGRSGFHHTDDLFNHAESFQWLQQAMDKIRNEYPGDFVNIQNGSPQIAQPPQDILANAWGGRSRCTAGRSAIMICTDGKVLPCEQMPETAEYFCGDVSTQSVQEVWDSDRLRELTYGMPREAFRGTECYDCAEREDCHNRMGYCIRDVAIARGTVYMPPQNCPKASLPFVRQF